MDDRENTLQTARRIVSQRLQSLQRAGVEQIGRPPPTTLAAPVGWAVPTTEPASAAHVTSLPPLPQPPSLRESEPSSPPTTSPSSMPRSASRPSSPPPSPPLPLSVTQPYPTDLPKTIADRQQLLDDLNAKVRGCTLCRELACTRTQTVFGVGHAKPRVVFFGEAPGADEDRQGEPFVGRAGQLLTKIIEACGWARSDVYIMNVLKCRPPDNRNPLPQETDNCRQYFERQFEILRPEYIVCAGTIPAQALLETDISVGKLRGRFHKYRNSTVLVTYHPSYLLRNPSAKKYVWDDMQMLLKEMGLPVPGKA
jgi:uracil-DNA glycosylase